MREILWSGEREGGQERERAGGRSYRERNNSKRDSGIFGVIKIQ